MSIDLSNNFDRNVFIMMRYRDSALFQQLEKTIRDATLHFDLNALFAKDSAYHDDLWQNIEHYMNNSKYGIAVFEEINEREFNPNVSMELGFMYAKKRRCLVLKDQRMPRLHTDICGRIYKDFDTYNIEPSVTNCIYNWCKNDINITPIDPMKSQSELDRLIEASSESFDFKIKSNWASNELLVVKDYLEENKRYIVWDVDKKKLFKYYKEIGVGKKWNGPYILKEEDELRVRNFLGIADV